MRNSRASSFLSMLLAIGISSSVITSVSRAQEPPLPGMVKKSHFDPEGHAKREVTDLFAGITISAEQRRLADSIATYALAKMTGVPHDAERGSKIRRIFDDRNFDLRALLTSEADKRKFDANLRKLLMAMGQPAP